MRKNTSVRAAAALAAIALLPAGAAAGEGGLVELTRGAATEWSLWTDARLGAPGRFAAGELRKYVERLSGAVLGEAPSPEAPRSIRFRLRSGGETGGPPRSPGFDGYGIIVAPLAIVVAADEPRGAVYAAYDILERLGCRWFYPEQDPGDPEVVPRKEVLALPAGSWSVASPIRHRLCNGSAWFFRLDLAAAGRQLDWAMKNRFNGMGWQAENATGLAEQYERMRAAGLIDDHLVRGHHEPDRRVLGVGEDLVHRDQVGHQPLDLGDGLAARQADVEQQNVGPVSFQGRWLGSCAPGQKPGDMVLPNGITVNVVDAAARASKHAH